MNKLSFDVFKTQVDKHYCGRLVPYENTYRGVSYYVKVHCNVHNIDFEVDAYSLYIGKANCQLCYKDAINEKKSKRLEQLESEISNITENYVLDILKNNEMPIIKKSFNIVYRYLLKRFPKPYKNMRPCSKIFIYMIEHNLTTYPKDNKGNYLSNSSFIYYIVKDTDEPLNEQYVLKCLKNVNQISSLKVHYPKAYEYLFSILYPLPKDYDLNIPTCNAIIYMIEHNYKEYPKSPVTGRYLKFVNSEKGFYVGQEHIEINSMKIEENKCIPSTFEELCEILCNHILALYDLDGNEIQYQKLEIKREKYSKFGVLKNWLYVDGILLHPKKYKVKYICRCGTENIIYLSKYLEKEILCCNKCSQSIKYGMTSCNSKDYKSEEKIITNQHREIVDFENATEELKKQYYEIHLTPEEFYINLKYFVKINKREINEDNIQHIKYVYAVPTNNYYGYSSKISFDDGQKYETLNEIYLKCSICGKPFKVHISNIRQKGDLNQAKCKKCNFTNHIYENKRYDNSTNLTYQSNLEKFFIDLIKAKGYEIENGPTILYFYRHWNKMREYLTDFYLPQFKIIVEIKGNNKWYKDDLKTGKFNDKCEAAQKYAEKHQMTFVVLFENDIEPFVDSLFLTN